LRPLPGGGGGDQFDDHFMAGEGTSSPVIRSTMAFAAEIVATLAHGVEALRGGGS